jgi:hypothetical protein
MTQVVGVRTASPPSVASSTRDLIRWVCTNNPFYVLSAGLFLGGLWVSFADQSAAENTWALMSGLAGYTLLLAVTACLLVRFGNVWDDVRTVLLLVVLMFLATSVTFDEVLVTGWRRGMLSRKMEGVACYLGGLLFAVVVTEVVLRGIRLRLPALFRIPYYLILALFFLYPLALAPWLDQPHAKVLLWGLFSFSTVGGLLFLTLLPAVRRGAAYLRNNGSPWAWPLYPWVLFGLLALAVPARAFMLCYSMQVFLNPVDFKRLVFGFYFLVPFGLSLTVLLLEIGLVSRMKGVLRTALLAPVGLVILAVVGHNPDPVYQEFLTTFRTQLGGTPLFLTLLASAGFYGYAALRRVPLAAEAAMAVLVLLAFVSPHSLTLHDLVRPGPIPILAAAGWQLALGLWRRKPWRWLLAGVGLAAAAALAIPEGAGAAILRTAIGFHLSLTTVLVVGAVCNDALGRQLRMVGAALVLLAGLATLFVPIDLPRGVPAAMIGAYPAALAAILAAYGLLLRHRTSQVVAGLVVLCWMMTGGWWAYSALRAMVRGLDYLVVSLVLFVLAILTSLAKSGVLSRGKQTAAGLSITSGVQPPGGATTP